MFGDPVLNPYKLKKDSFRHICEELFAGGDKPSDIVLTKDETHPYPVYANGYENLGFMGFSSQCRVNKPAITISARGTIGFSCIRQAGFTPIVRLLTLIPKTGIDLDYLKFAIDFYSFTSSWTSQKQLTVPDIAKYEVLVPDYSSQQCFATFVHQLDKLKFILQKMIEKLELLKKSRFVEMFGNIKETIPLENCCSLISDFVASGSFASLRDNVKYYDKENYAVLVRTIDFANNFSKDLVYTDKHGYDFLSKTNLYGGEILLSNIGASIGKVFRVPYLNKPMTLAPNSIVIKPNDNYTNEFLEYFFSIGRGQDELHVMTTATATPKFNKTQLRQVPVPKVSKEIQNDFSCFVKQLDKSKLILQKQLDDLVGETK